MPRHLLLSSLVLAACGAAPAPAPAPANPTAAPNQPAREWRQAMRRVGARFDELTAALDKSPYGEGKAIAASATAAASDLRLGYGRCVDQRVPQFAAMARGAESWLLAIAAEAAQDHTELAAEQFARGKERHCGACHEASKPFYSW